MKRLQKVVSAKFEFNTVMMVSRSILRSCVIRNRVLVALLFGALALPTILTGQASARPVPKGKKDKVQPERFIRQTNNYSNIFFYLTNKGVLFNSGNGQAEGLFWPRGSSNSYIFGCGLWFATKKIISGRRQKLCEIGYNPNSGAGWYAPGEYNDPDNGSNVDSKYISYLSSRYDKYKGTYSGAPSSFVPDANVHWPLWDTSLTRTIKQNFYFGDYISKVADRDQASLQTKMGATTKKIAAPAMLSQEDIVDFYDDADPTQNPEFKPNTGYPFGLNIQEVVYSWSFGKYRDLLFVRYKAQNTSKDTLHECYLAPAFDPDLGDPANDHNTYLADADSVTTKQNPGLVEPFRSHPSKLNMAYQFSEQEGGKEYGVVGFSFLESPTINPSSGEIIDNSDSAAIGGYGPNGLKQLGLKTFQKWTLQNDPSTQDLRYDFMAANTLNTDKNAKGDMRLLFATGPFVLPPGKFVETTIGIGIALADLKTQSKNIDSCIRLMAFAQSVFNNQVGVDSAPQIHHFLSPVPPEVPNLHTQALDRAVLVTWDSAAENSVDPLTDSKIALPFIGYQLYRTTRSDHDSTIRPDGQNPVIKLGEWALYDFRQDTLFDTKGKVSGFRFHRINSTPHPIPHSYLDVGDDNHTGALEGNEGLKNGIRYYYYLIAYDEYDSVNNVGPLYTAIVAPKNFVSEIPTKPPFVGIPDSTLLSPGNLGCLGNGVSAIHIDIADTGKFEQLFTNDTINVKLQERWSEFAQSFGNLPGAINQSPLNLYVDVSEQRNGINITYDKDFNPAAAPPITPYNFATGLVNHVIGQQGDSTFTGRFTTENVAFAPYQLVDQAFRVLLDYKFVQLTAPYRLHSIDVAGADPAGVHLSPRTLHVPTGAPAVSLANLDSVTSPSFLGSLGEATYEVDFGAAIPFGENDFDTTKKAVFFHNSIVDKTTKTTFSPDVLPVTVMSIAQPCGTLKHIRPGQANDVTTEFDCRYYSACGCSSMGTPAPTFSDPDSMHVPIPGHFALDAYHYTVDDRATNSNVAPFTGPDQRTTGPVYFSHNGLAENSSGAKHLVTVHRLRLAGAEIILNPQEILSPESGDSVAAGTPVTDFKAGDKLTVQFTGGSRGLPFPDSTFIIYTSGRNNTNFTDNRLYDPAAVLSQVQVVPNPYIVTHDGQTSTDNAKLYFTRLPPRCTIEIYSIAGDLIKTIEHNGYASTSLPDPNNIGGTLTTYDYTQLGDRYSQEEWNLLSEGRQRVGSQVLIARIIARDPISNAELAETTTKFAVVLGGFHIVGKSN